MSAAVTIRVEKPDVLEKLDKLAKSTDRSRNWLLNRALEEFVELQSWQVAKIEEGLAQADRGEFVPQSDIDRLRTKYRREP